MEAQKRWYAETLPLRDAPLVVDVGANVGELSEFFFAQIPAAARVLSIEPLAENVAQIEQRIARAHAAERWQVRQCAVSEQDGEVSLRIGSSEGTAHNSFVIPEAVQPGTGRVIRVPAYTLSALAKHARIIKLDIEGHEYPVLAESLVKLSEVHAWAIELHMVAGQSLAATVRSFLRAGYRVLGAGQQRGDTSGRWMSLEVPEGMEWDSVPVAQHRPDGSAFKMLHVIALRR